MTSFLSDIHTYRQIDRQMFVEYLHCAKPRIQKQNKTDVVLDFIKLTV